MTFKIEYTMYSGSKYIEYVNSLEQLKNVFCRVTDHQGDDKNVSRIEVYIINQVPLSHEPVHGKFLCELCFSYTYNDIMFN